MANYKNDRLNEDIRREISVIVQNMKDPRIQDSMLTIVRTELSGDQSHCKVFVSSLQGTRVSDYAIKVLRLAAGYIGHELFVRVAMRKLPQLHFIADDSIEQSAKLSAMMLTLENREAPPNPLNLEVLDEK